MTSRQAVYAKGSPLEIRYLKWNITWTWSQLSYESYEFPLKGEYEGLQHLWYKICSTKSWRRRNLPMKTCVSLTTNLAAGLQHHNFGHKNAACGKHDSTWVNTPRIPPNWTFTKIKMEALLWSRKIFNLYQLITCNHLVLLMFFGSYWSHYPSVGCFLGCPGKPHRHTASRCHADLFICLLDILLDPWTQTIQGALG